MQKLIEKLTSGVRFVTEWLRRPTAAQVIQFMQERRLVRRTTANGETHVISIVLELPGVLNETMLVLPRGHMLSHTPRDAWGEGVFAGYELAISKMTTLRAKEIRQQRQMLKKHGGLFKTKKVTNYAAKGLRSAGVLSAFWMTRV